MMYEAARIEPYQSVSARQGKHYLPYISTLSLQHLMHGYSQFSNESVWRVNISAIQEYNTHNSLIHKNAELPPV